MARHVMIFCQDSKSINFKDIAEFITDGWFFDECPEFNIGENFLGVTYDSNLRPIVIQLFDNPQIVEEIKKDRYEETIKNIKCESINDKNKINEIETFIAACTNIYDIEFSWSDLSEDCWAMMTCVESFLAKEKKGIIFAD